MVQISIDDTSVSGNIVNSGMFSTNYLTRFYSAATDGNFAAAITLAGVTGLRFPGGAMTEESFDMTDPNRAFDDQGRKLTPMDGFLEFAKTTGSEVTIVIPTREMFRSATDGHGNRFIDAAKVAEVKTFVTNTLEDLKQMGNVTVTDIIKAFELGNEYWGSGEMTSTEYGRVVNALAPVIEDAIAQVLGQSAVGDIGILAQMGGPWGSEFEANGLYGSLNATSNPALLAELGLDAGDFGTNGKLKWNAKVELSNTDIIEQINPGAKSAVTGLVEHFYLATDANDLTYSSDTLRQINVDMQFWRDAGYTDKDLVITEWNIQADNAAQYGLKGAGAFLFQFESMIQMGVDEAFTWPLLSSRTTELAGALNGAPYLTPAGAALQHMAANLTGLHLLDVNDTTAGLEISAYGSQSTVVMYLSSRDVARMQLQADVSGLVDGFVLTSAEMIGVDMATSDGRHVGYRGGTVSVPYYAEHDVRAEIRDLNEAQIFNANTITASIGAYEVLMLVFERPEVVSMVTYTLAQTDFALALGGLAAINGGGNALANLLTGNDAANHMTGGLGDDTLIGNGGADTLVGEGGNDVYIIDSRDTIIEVQGGGIDRVEANFSYTLGSNLENLTLTGSAAINGAGNTLNNVIIGNAAANWLGGGAGNDTLDGGRGRDTLSGGFGDDTYLTEGTDVVTEVAGGGIDHVISTGTTWLSLNVENLTLAGAAAIDATGNALNNRLVGNAANNLLSGWEGNDTLEGGAGADTLVGGSGDDTYLTDGTDVVTEEEYRGIDHVISTGTTWLRANVENLTLAGAAAIDATGNELDNRLVGNAANNLLSGWRGNDTLEGGAGADTLVGGAGNDTYIVDPFDTLVEAKWQGLDLVISAYSYRLGVNFENLTLVGNGHITATGNALNNVLTGNAGNNILDGGAGQDTLIGGAGNDTYYTNSGETFIELADEGIDHVFASVTHSLFANIENLTLTGVWNTSALGNNLDNILTGNSGANRLDGGAGNDTLNGGLGNDTFLGGAGADCFVFNATLGTTNVDTIVDFNVVEDMIHLENAIFTGLASGTLAASAFTANLSGLATSFTQRIIYETDTGKLFFDADGSGSRAAVHFADLQPALALTSADFFVF